MKLKNFFNPLVKLLKTRYKKKILKIAIYYPSNYETNILKILENNYFKNKKFLLPVIEKNNMMNFFLWKKK